MQVVYMIIDETSFGPVFSSREKAIEHYATSNNMSIEEATKELSTGDYPDIEEITLDDGKYYRDR